MPQLHFYVLEPVAKQIQLRASMAGVSTSRYVADLVQKEMGSGWPEDFFDTVVGSWVGEPLTRPPQGKVEAREFLQPLTAAE